MINEKLATLPHLPGVYIFKNNVNEPIYIGKAKSLKRRVNSYFKTAVTDWKVELLQPEIADLQYIVTKNETEALLLEAELVHKHQPKFNILLKDGQPFVYLLISKQEPAELKLVRNKQEKGIYFGPFLYKGQVRSVFHFLLDHFQLRLCNKKIANGCLQYHLGRCAGSCKDDFVIEEYLFRLELVKKILKSDTHNLEKSIDERIALHSKNRAYELAQKLAKIRQNLTYVIDTIKLKFNPLSFDLDVTYALAPIKQPLPDPTLGTQLAQLLNLPITAHRIDCFDISHSQSHAMVGSCVRFTQGIPDKHHFRHFNIKSLATQNDYAALQEIVIRRYKNLAELPDLIVIDGGKGQLNAIKQLFPQTITISLAKREERVFCSHTQQEFILKSTEPAAKLLLALRDYAHHFAITHHRNKVSLTHQLAKKSLNARKTYNTATLYSTHDHHPDLDTQNP